MEKITSRQNKTVREAAALLSSAEERAARGEFLWCQDAARSGIEVLRCFVTAQALEKYAAYLQPVLERARQSYLVADHVAGLLSSTKSPQGVFCQCRWPQGLLAGDAAGGGSCAVLEDLQILRTAEALGIGRVVLLGDCCDPLSPKALRASMGAVFRLGLSLERSRQGLFSRLRGEGFRLLASVPDSAALPVTEVDFSQGPCAVFIGNEGNGLSQETIAQCQRVTIPMAGRLPWITAPIGFGCSRPLGRAAPCLGASTAACPAGWRLSTKAVPGCGIPWGASGSRRPQPCSPFPWRRPRPSWSTP